MTYEVLLLGGSGSIGRATAVALVAAGHRVTALLRPGARVPPGCRVAQGQAAAPGTVAALLSSGAFDAVVSCLASRTGAPRDAMDIDYTANSLALRAAVAAGVGRFVLLSAICVQKPLLAFQHAKLAFEAELQAAPLTWSIVRPTAYFKSLSGQVLRVRDGRAFMVFGDGRLTACTPISDRDLGEFLAGCLTDPARAGRILPIGGPGPAITPLDQAAMLGDLLGRPVPLRRVPVRLMDGIIGALDLAGALLPGARSRATLARIGRYYATESMLVLNPATGRHDRDLTPSHGSDTLRDHYAAILRGEVADDRGDHAVF